MSAVRVASSYMSSDLPRIHAHRGCCEEAQESTIPAFQLAIARGADGIEFNLQLTQDPAIVVHHDYILGRTNNGNGLVAEHSLNDLRLLDADSWYDPKFSGTRIPEFREVLALAHHRCTFEVQLCAISEYCVWSVLESIKTREAHDRIEITSGFSHVLMKVRRLSPTIKIGVFIQDAPSWMPEDLWLMQSLQTMRLIQAQVAHLPLGRVQANVVDVFQQNGFEVHAADCNTELEIKDAIAAGVDQLSTDTLSLAMDVRSNSGSS